MNGLFLFLIKVLMQFFSAIVDLYDGPVDTFQQESDSQRPLLEVCGPFV